MQPGSGENQPISFEIPKPSSGETADDASLEALPTKSPENKQQTQSVAASSDAASAIALPSQAIATSLSSDDPASDPLAAASSAGTDTDKDRIDKVWLDKAKTVIAKTKDDPFTQKQQISQVKAQYIKTRFNKTIKADDPVAQ